MASQLGACFVTPYLAEPPAPWAALIRLVPRAAAWALTLLLSASFAAIFWLPEAGLATIVDASISFALVGFFIAVPVALGRVYRRAGPLGRRRSHG